jgi:hypothetical protein
LSLDHHELDDVLVFNLDSWKKMVEEARNVSELMFMVHGCQAFVKFVKEWLTDVQLVALEETLHLSPSLVNRKCRFWINQL